jgi:hypothetical protein
MTDQELELLSQEINAVAAKYNLYHVSFCAMLKKNDERQFVGLIGSDMKDSFDFTQSILAVGRLWQSAREKMIQVLNKFEKRI